MTKWGNHCYIEEPVLQKLRFITKWGRYYKLGQKLWKSEQVIYYKVGQPLLQSEVGVIKWGNYYRKGQYIFVTPGQMEIHVYRQGQCVRRLKFIRFKRVNQSFYVCNQNSSWAKISDLFLYTYLVKHVVNI